MPKILNELQDDHKNMSRLFDLLGRELLKFKEGEHPDYDLVENILEYCLDYPDLIHHPKEDLIFEKLRTRNPAIVDSIGDLKKEHAKLATSTLRFSTAVRNVLEDGQLPRDWFLDMGNDFLTLSRNHMQMEEVLFFPAARKNLKPTDWKELELAVENGEDPVFGEIKRERYSNLFQKIMDWGKVLEDLEKMLEDTAQTPKEKSKTG